jgi:hypothetical protein
LWCPFFFVFVAAAAAVVIVDCGCGFLLWLSMSLGTSFLAESCRLMAEENRRAYLYM